jgi:hypothetical protein
MKALEKFDRLGQNNYNGLSVLKNSYLKKYPIHLTTDTSDYSLVRPYAADHEFVWLVDKNIKTLNTFPWHFNPDEKDCVHLFPYVHKRSKKPIDWGHVRLIPTRINTDKFKQHRHICAEYDVYQGKEKFDVFFSGDKNTGTWDQVISKFPDARPVSSHKEAQEKSTTDMFWYVPDDVEILDNFSFDYEPDDWSLDYIHVFANGRMDQFDGIVLFPKNANISEKEFEHRFYANKKQVRKVITKPRKYCIYKIDTYNEYLTALENSPFDMFWGISENIKVDADFKFDIYFSHSNAYDRNINHAFVHQVNDENFYNGVFLFSKNAVLSEKEIVHRHLVERKEWNNIASVPVQYDRFVIETYDDYLYALENSNTEMFWATSNNLKIDPNFKFDLYLSHDDYDRKQNHAFVHEVDGKKYYNGIFLLSKHTLLSQREIEHRHLVERKEWDIVASVPKLYDCFVIETYDDYLAALKNAKTEMFWATSNNIDTSNFDFNIYFTHDNEYDRKQNHAFVHEVDGKKYYNGIFLLSKYKPVSEKEITYRHLVERKEWDIVASGPVQYDKFTVDTYDDYLTALENSKTEMFWAISSNVNISGFNFDIYFTHDNEYDRKQNHAFVHEVDGKKYYNGIFLLPKVSLTDDVDKFKDSF